MLYRLECLAFACALLYRLEPVEPFGFVLYRLYRLYRLERLERLESRAQKKAGARKSERPQVSRVVRAIVTRSKRQPAR